MLLFTWSERSIEAQKTACWTNFVLGPNAAASHYNCARYCLFRAMGYDHAKAFRRAQGDE